MFTGLFRRNPESSDVTPLESQTIRQIDSLRRHNPALLPPNFPQAKPVITVTPPVRHPLVIDEEHVGCPELLNFSMHSDLGKLVVHIVEEFQKNPPMTVGHRNHRLPTPHLYPSVNTGLDSAISSPPLHHQHSSTNFVLPNSVYRYTPGSKKTSLHLPFPQESSYQSDSAQNSMTSTFHTHLKALSLEELQALNNDEDRLQEFIDSMPLMQKLSLEKEELAKINEELSVENLNKRPVLENRKKIVLEMVDTVSSLRQTFDEYSHRHHVLSGQYSPAAIQENLKFAALQAEEESEQIAEQFLEGKMEIEEFLSRFMDKRTLGHCRRAKEEKLDQQLLELKRSGF